MYTFEEFSGLINGDPDELNQYLEKCPDAVSVTVNSPDGTPESLLSIAVKRLAVPAARVLTEHGANEQEREDLWFVVGKEGPGVLASGSLVQMLQLVKKASRYSSPLLREDAGNVTKVIWLQWLIDNGGNDLSIEFIDAIGLAEIDNLADMEREFCATQNFPKSLLSRILDRCPSNTGMIRALINAGASPDALPGEAISPLGSLFKSETSRRLFSSDPEAHLINEAFQLLLDAGVDIGKEKYLPEKIARSGVLFIETIEALFERYPEWWSDAKYVKSFCSLVFDNYHETHLLWLCEKGILSQQTIDGLPVLVKAVEIGNIPVVTALISSGAFVNEICEVDGDQELEQTVLDLAIYLNRNEITDVLRSAGAQTAKELGLVHSSGRSPRKILRRMLRTNSWTLAAFDSICSLSIDAQYAWLVLFEHFETAKSGKPTIKWMNQLRSCLDSIIAEGECDHKQLIYQWLSLSLDKNPEYSVIKEQTGYPWTWQNWLKAFCESEYQYSDKSISYVSGDLLKGLVCATYFFDECDTRLLRKVAIGMYRKIYGGPRSIKVANAVMHILAMLPDNNGVTDMVLVMAATRYSASLYHIHKLIDEKAGNMGVSRDVLLEQAAPDFGFETVGVYREPIGDYSAIVRISNERKAELTWQKAGDTKEQKSVPAGLKESHADDIKDFKSLLKDVDLVLASQTRQLESFFLRKEKLQSMADFRKIWLDHPIHAVLARRLIWRLHHHTGYVDVLWSSDKLTDVGGAAVLTDELKNVQVQLWHPILSTREEILLWRQRILAAEITQPFKQAHREVYLLTDAERASHDHSLRFANHILIQSQFHALATQRGWQQVRGGQWDSGDYMDATRKIPDFDLRARVTTGAYSDDMNAGGIYMYTATDRVVFERGVEGFNCEKIALEDMDAQVFSEIMRDVDLFVSVASVGNDPDWRAYQERPDFYNSSGFGELGEADSVRRDVLKVIIPKLKIARQLEIDGRFLTVQGKRTRYKIHLRSTNILMEPNDQYLCIVGGAKAQLPLLPFDDDRALALILSKALLLASDDKIKDQTILSQLPPLPENK